MEPQDGLNLLVLDSLASVEDTSQATIGAECSTPAEAASPQHISQTVLKLTGLPELRRVLTLPETAPDALERLQQLVMVLGQLRTMLATQSQIEATLPKLEPTPENLAPYVEDEAYEVLAALERHAERAAGARLGERHPALQRYMTIESLMPRLLWYIARSHYPVMQLLGGMTAKILVPSPQLSPLSQLSPSSPSRLSTLSTSSDEVQDEVQVGMLRLAAILTLKCAGISWQIDLATHQPPQTAMAGSTYVQSAQHPEPIAVADWIAQMVDRFQTNTPELQLFLNPLAVDILVPGCDWQSGSIQLQLALTFAPFADVQRAELEEVVNSHPPSSAPDRQPVPGQQDGMPQGTIAQEPSPQAVDQQDTTQQGSISQDLTQPDPVLHSSVLQTAIRQPSAPPDLAPLDAVQQEDTQREVAQQETVHQEITQQVPSPETIAPGLSVAILPPNATNNTNNTDNETLLDLVSDLESLSIDSLPEPTEPPTEPLGVIQNLSPIAPIEDKSLTTSPTTTDVSTDVSTDHAPSRDIDSRDTETATPDPSSAGFLEISTPDVITLDMFRAELPIAPDPSLALLTDAPTELTLEALEDELTDVADILMPGMFMETTLPPATDEASQRLPSNDAPTLAIFEQELSDAVESVLKGSPDAVMSLAEFAELVVEAHTHPSKEAEQATPQDIATGVATESMKLDDQPVSDGTGSPASLGSPSYMPQMPVPQLMQPAAQSQIAIPDVRIVIDPSRSVYAAETPPATEAEAKTPQQELGYQRGIASGVDSGAENMPESLLQAIAEFVPEVPLQAAPELAEETLSSFATDLASTDLASTDLASTDLRPDLDAGLASDLASDLKTNVVTETLSEFAASLATEQVVEPVPVEENDQAIAEPREFAEFTAVVPERAPVESGKAIAETPDAGLPPEQDLLVELVSTIDPEDSAAAALYQVLLTNLPALQAVYPSTMAVSSLQGEPLQDEPLQHTEQPSPQPMHTLVALAWQMLDQLAQMPEVTEAAITRSATPITTWVSYLLWQVTRYSYEITQLMGGVAAHILKPNAGWASGRVRLLVTLRITTADAEWFIDLSTGTSPTIAHPLAPGVLLQSPESDVLQEPQQVEPFIHLLTQQLQHRSPLITLLTTGTGATVNITPDIAPINPDIPPAPTQPEHCPENADSRNVADADATHTTASLASHWQLGTMALHLCLATC